MKTSDFDYELPEELIAQEPLEPRDASRMMVLRRDKQLIRHSRFRDLPRYLRSGDVLVFNRTRVIPARLRARKIPTGGKAELLLLKRLSPNRWEAIVRGRKLAEGTRLRIMNHEGALTGPIASVETVKDSGTRVLVFETSPERWLPHYGETPLPPYIRTHLKNPERYQTVFSDTPGAVAAPTAGLHFTWRLLEQVRQMSVQTEYVTLHVGLDTFRPVRTENIENHTIHSEWCQLDSATCDRLRHAKQEGRRIIAVGTTVVRVLETSALRAHESGLAGHAFAPLDGETDLFIIPGYRFRAIDALLTNFHLPRSTLLMLVSAFAGRDLALRAYQEAVRQRYRFFSFGDCMLIL